MNTTINKMLAAAFAQLAGVAAQFGVEVDPILTQSIAGLLTIYLVWQVPNRGQNK